MCDCATRIQRVGLIRALVPRRGVPSGVLLQLTYTKEVHGGAFQVVHFRSQFARPPEVLTAGSSSDDALQYNQCLAIIFLSGEAGKCRLVSLQRFFLIGRFQERPIPEALLGIWSCEAG